LRGDLTSTQHRPSFCVRAAAKGAVADCPGGGLPALADRPWPGGYVGLVSPVDSRAADGGRGELYTKAADQLGSDNAAVRLAGLYALERLAQNTPKLRQTVGEVLCAYLRMPFTPPPERPGGRRLGAVRRPLQPAGLRSTSAADRARNRPPAPVAADQDQRQEREVRLAAQRVLAAHLRPGPDPDHPVGTFWRDIDLDLTDATLIDLDLRGSVIGQARFGRATFTGRAEFDGTTFTGDTWFGGATFCGEAGFGGANFYRDAWFDEATFTGRAGFGGATFTGDAGFDGARLPSTRYIDDRTSSPWTNFDGAWFERAMPVEVAPFVAEPPDAAEPSTGDRSD
jgi:hypothetical protein